MRKVMLLLTCVISLQGYCPEVEFKVEKFKENPVNVLIKAISHVESRHKLNAVNGKEDAYGHLQIRNCVVQDVNRHFGTQYKVTDALDSLKAVDIFIKYQQIYTSEFNPEVMARIWNGGPKGYLKSNTYNYWHQLVKPQMDRFNSVSSYYQIIRI